MKSNRLKSGRMASTLLVGTILSAGLFPAAALAQVAEPDVEALQDVEQPVAVPAQQPVVQQQVASDGPVQGTVRSIRVAGAERIEPETVIAYSTLQPGETYTATRLDEVLRTLYQTQLFADVVITGGETGSIVITVAENPVVNRIIIEGNDRLKDDKIAPEIRLAPRQIFTADKVRADVDRIVELYKREGRFAAIVEPKIVQLDQNRVDLIFEITEGAKSKIRSINVIGNEQFSDDRLVKAMFSREAGGFLGFLKSNTSYDPDRLAADQQKLRSFYLTEGYADFRTVNALAELTPDREDFVITYVVEEGPRYRFGDVSADSALRDFPVDEMLEIVQIQQGEWFDAKRVEDAVTRLNETAGLLGYAFADVAPVYDRNAEDQTIDLTFRTGNTQRVYIDSVNITGNTTTRDNVIRREFRLFEGDPFNAVQISRSEDRIRSLGFFQPELSVTQERVSDDRIALNVEVEENPTGQISFQAGYSSLEQFLLAASIAERNFMGKGQTLNAGVNYSRYSKSVQAGFSEPYLFGRPILFGADIYRRDYNSFNFIGGERQTTYSQISTGGGARVGFPITEYLSAGARYTLVLDNIDLSRERFFTDFDGNGTLDANECDPQRAGAYLCDELGDRITSAIGYSLAFDNTDGVRATRGLRAAFLQDFAGLGGDVKYLRTRANATKYFELPADFILSLNAQGGYIFPLDEDDGVEGRDGIRITDRFFGPPNFRGFDIRGIGPRVERLAYDGEGNLVDDSSRRSNSLGGRAFYFGRMELEVPVSASVRNLGLRPSAYVDIGSVFDLTQPTLANVLAFCTPVDPESGLEPQQIIPGEGPQSCAELAGADNVYLETPGYREFFRGNSVEPRISVGVGVNWISPFGPLRIDLATALLKQEGDETKLFSFNVGSQF